MDEPTIELTMNVGLFMTHNVLDFIVSDEGSKAFAEFISDRTPGEERADWQKVQENAQQLHDWFQTIIPHLASDMGVN